MLLELELCRAGRIARAKRAIVVLKRSGHCEWRKGGLGQHARG